MALKPARGLWPRCRRALYWTHRWLGVAGCLLFAMWFFSGVVMMYVAFPALTDDERIAGLPALDLDAAVVGPADAMAALTVAVRDRLPRRLMLEAIAAGPQAGPIWRIVDADGERHAISARDGRPLAPVGPEAAAGIGRAFAGASADTFTGAAIDTSTGDTSTGSLAGPSTARFVETLERDQWTVPNGLNPLRPLHRIEVGDAAGTELYVSAVSGEVVRDTTRHERFWNWLGAVPHWIYFTPLRADPPLWRDVVLWISGICMVSAVTGLVIGILRVRVRSRYRDGRMIPYRGWFAWHHVAGLVGGVFVLTWMVSGWLSMDPNRWFQRVPPDGRALERYADLVTAASLGRIDWPLPAALRSTPEALRELQFLPFAGEWLVQGRDRSGRTAVLAARSGHEAVIGPDRIRSAAQRYLPAASIVGVSLLEREDVHWYSHHQRRPVPVWRVIFDDAARTWLHVSPVTGQILAVSDERSRTRRWLFNGLHSLDLPWLIHYRPAWDLFVWLLSLAGLVVSVSGVVIGWRRLRKDFLTAS